MVLQIIVLLLAWLLTSSLAQFLHLASAPEVVPVCKPLNQKPRDFFFLYHITFNGGTNMWRLADSAGLPWDGMNGIFVPEQNQTKTELMNMWFTNISYTTAAGGRVLPADLFSWGIRKNPHHVQVMNNFTRMRRYAAIEYPLDHIWGGVPVDEERVNSMIVMRNPLALFMKFVEKYKGDQVTKPVSIFAGKHNYAIRWLSGHMNAHHMIDHDHLTLSHIGGKITEEHFLVAAARLKQFDHVLILEDMHETTRFLCCEWGWKVCTPFEPKERRMEKAHKTPRKWFDNDAHFREFLEATKWDFKLYDLAVSVALAQLHALGVNSSVLETFPVDSRLALLDGLDLEIATEINANVTERRLLEDQQHVPAWMMW